METVSKAAGAAMTPPTPSFATEVIGVQLPWSSYSTPFFGVRTQMDESKQYVEQLIKKAADAEKPDDAMKFAQAATNAANAMCALQIALKPQ